MKKFLLSLVGLTLGLTGFAASVTFNFTTDDYGLERKSGNATDGYLTDGQSLTQGDVKLTFNGDSAWRLWTDGLREYYKNSPTFTVSTTNGSKVTGVTLSLVSGATFKVDGYENGGNITAWSGSADSVTFTGTASANKAVEAITITYEGEGSGSTDPGTGTEPEPTPTPDGDEVVALYYVVSVPGGVEYTSATELKNNGADVVTNPTSFVNGDITVSFTKKNSSASNVNGAQLRWYQNDIMNITVANGGTITGVFINSTQGTVTSTVGTVSKSGNTYSWTGSVSGTLELTASAQVRFNYMTVTYEPGTPLDVDQPVIKFDEATNTVTITCETADANIYYTLDGTKPDNTSLKYTAPFTINENVTVIAIAELNGQYSYTATEECYYVGTYDNFADYVAANPTHGGKVMGPITAIYQNGINLYTKDNAGGFMLIYGNGPALSNGDQISYIAGNYSPYNGLPEIVPTEFGEVTTGDAEVEPVITTLTDLKDATLNSYVKFVGVKVTADSGRNYTMTDTEGNTGALYNTFNTNVTVPDTDDYYDVVGFVGTYNGNIQVTPVSFTVNPTTGVASIATENAPAVFYNLQGVKVVNPVKGGLYIVNGKKVIF